MGEPKAFASLSSGLLARKGAARPAMRPQGFGQGGSSLEDLGWNDMGFEPPKPAIAPVLDEDHDAFGDELPEQPLRNPLAALTPIASPVHDQQAEIAERFAAHDEDGEANMSTRPPSFMIPKPGTQHRSPRLNWTRSMRKGARLWSPSRFALLPKLQFVLLFVMSVRVPRREARLSRLLRCAWILRVI
jgi:hypothetical protein